MVDEIIKIGKYVRCSTDKQEIKAQNETLDKYIEYAFKDKTIEVYDYMDIGYTGKNMKRERMEALQQDILANKINTVVALKLDRLSRSLQDLLLLFEFFKTQNIDIRIVKDNIDTSTTGGKLMFQIMGAFAEFERSTTTERLSMGREYAKQHGTKSGMPMNRPRKEINIKECIDLYKKGLSMNKLGAYYKVSAMTIRSRLKEKGIVK